jgi:hypothetical protein
MEPKKGKSAPMVEVSVIKQPCFFCGQDETIACDEHYILCPNCRACYTYMIIRERGCDHIPGWEPDNCPLLIDMPKDLTLLEGKTYIEANEFGDRQYCSVCGATCVADGW